MKIDINKKYRTRDGQEVTHLYRVPEGYPTRYPWRGIVQHLEEMWTDDGDYDMEADVSNRMDLIEVREPREWVIGCHGLLDAAVVKEGPIPDTGETIRVREIMD